MSYYRSGRASLGAMMWDQQLSRLEALKASAVSDLNNLVTRADGTAKKVSVALVASAAVTGLSTIAIVLAARKARRS